MADYTCTHLPSGEQFRRARTLVNPHVKHEITKSQVDPAILRYHQSLPDYAVTPLHSLPDVATELGFAHVFLKDESNRFGLPSFKAAGASWALYRMLCERLNLRIGTSRDELAQAVKQHGDLRIVTVTEGNWGRAVGRFAKLLGVPVVIYVSDNMHPYTQNLLRSEGAEVRVLDGLDYDECLATAFEYSKESGAMLILDIAVGGLEDSPKWVVEGYSTILQEVDQQVIQQTGAQQVDIATCSVGCGSWAEAIVRHYGTQTQVVSVEPDTAASLKEGLHCGKPTYTQTANTIMNGMNCGTTSSAAWPVLRDGISIATTVTDHESHACVQKLQGLGINSGPCGAANLAALRGICADVDLGERKDKVVVLFSSEGRREYKTPV